MAGRTFSEESVLSVADERPKWSPAQTHDTNWLTQIFEHLASNPDSPIYRPFYGINEGPLPGVYVRVNDHLYSLCCPKASRWPAGIVIEELLACGSVHVRWLADAAHNGRCHIDDRCLWGVLRLGRAHMIGFGDITKKHAQTDAEYDAFAKSLNIKPAAPTVRDVLINHDRTYLAKKAKEFSAQSLEQECKKIEENDGLLEKHRGVIPGN